MSAYIRDVEPGSYAGRHGIKPGCTLLKINGHDIKDVLDYRFFMVDRILHITYRNEDGKFAICKIVKKDEYDDIGLIFDTYLMDKQRSCKNKCIFCFIDQLPKGMRESLYFKDDDSRMSFFYGNYITLTNLDDSDVERIIDMHISPVNVSVHTMNPDLRCKMMNNRFAGDSLRYLRRLSEAGIAINTQLVLCPGINDGEELRFSIEELFKLSPAVSSVACVPVGLTDHRDGLYPLSCYTREQAADTLKLINDLGDRYKASTGKRFCYAADEFYLKAEAEIPPEEYYEGYPQLDNGVGLMRLLETEVDDALEEFSENPEKYFDGERKTVIATGVAAFPLIKKLACKVETLYNKMNRGRNSNLNVQVYEIKNEFFGRNITVSGLITGQDLVAGLKEKAFKNGEFSGDLLLIPSSMVRTTYPQDDSGDKVLLDDVTIDDISNALSVPVLTVDNDGYEFTQKIMEAKTCQDR